MYVVVCEVLELLLAHQTFVRIFHFCPVFFAMQRMRFAGSRMENNQGEHPSKSGSMNLKKGARYSDSGGRPGGTQAKQRKIYEVWQGDVPQRFKQSIIKNEGEGNVWKSYSRSADQAGTSRNVPHQKQMGASGAVAFHPCYPPAPDIYMQPRSQYAACPPWWGGNGMPYIPGPDMSASQYGGYMQIGLGMFRDCPPLFPDRHVAPGSTYGYQQQQQHSVKPQRTVTLPSKMKQAQPTASQKCAVYKTDPVVNPKSSKVVEKSTEKAKPKKLFISTNVRGLQAWTEAKLDVMIIFEIIGMLNSQVTATESIHCKSFLLKDSQGHVVTCEFFEADRQLGRMCRGKTYRCVGSFSSRRGTFHAVGVREGEEKDVRIYRKLVAICNGTLKTFRENSK